MDNYEQLMKDMRNFFQEEVKNAYLEGAHQGAITTCATIYATMRAAGLEEGNFLFTILKDCAHMHGCEDLEGVIQKLQKIQAESNEPNILS